MTIYYLFGMNMSFDDNLVVVVDDDELKKVLASIPQRESEREKDVFVINFIDHHFL